MAVLLWAGSRVGGGPARESYRLFILKWTVGLIPAESLEGSRGLREGVGGRVEDLGGLFVICSHSDALVVIKCRLRMLPLLRDLHLQGGP